MKELSLHILDITQNSIRAGAALVELCIVEDTLEDLLSITISDDGCGIPKDRLADITNPFVTSRTTRKVGLGLPLFKAAAEGCDGRFTIRSEEGVGTTVEAVFKRSHIDRAPLGNMADTVMTMLLSFNHAELLYIHHYNGRTFEFDTRQIKAILEAEDLLTDPEVLGWIRGYVAEGLEGIMEE